MDLAWILSRFGGFITDWQVEPIVVDWQGGELYV